jgi:hypothetical protein
MRKKSFAKNLISGIILITGFLIIGCNGEDKDSQKKDIAVDPTDTTKKGEVQINSLKQMSSFIMHKDGVKRLFEKQGQGGSAKNKHTKVILRFATSDAGINFELIAYPAKGHKDYGSGNDTIVLRKITVAQYDDPLKFNSGTQYIFGNNEIILPELAKLAEDGYGNYNYLKFSPKYQDKPSEPTKGQIYFKIEACDATGKVITIKDYDAQNSNPSPPAKPDETEL